MECPKNGGSNYYNYKAFHSLVLMAICDANYCFSLVDIGGFGSDNDASIFSQSQMGFAFEKNDINILEVQDVDFHMLPYVLVSDEIFLFETMVNETIPREKSK